MSAEPPTTILLRVSAFLDRQESNLETQIHGHLGFSAVFKLFAFALDFGVLYDEIVCLSTLNVNLLSMFSGMAFVFYLTFTRDLDINSQKAVVLPR